MVTKFEKSVPAGLSLRVVSEGSSQSFCGLAPVCVFGEGVPVVCRQMSYTFQFV